METLAVILLFSALVGLIAGDTISPERDEVSGREGESVTLTCTYDTSYTLPELNWYRHYSDLQAPQFILWKGGKSEDGEYIPDKRYKSQTSDTTTELTIQNLTLADTALYYCSLAGNQGGLELFGKNITLTVNPKDVSPVPPNLFALNPLMPDGGWGSSPLPPDVCLATGFYPKTAEMILNVKNGPADKLDTSKAVMSTQLKGYFFAGFTNKTLLSCEMKGKTSTIGSSSNKSSPADKSSSSNNETSNGFHQSTNNYNLDLCKDVHPEKARLNFFLLVMNGVRVIFTKTVAFSTLLTIRAVIF